LTVAGASAGKGLGAHHVDGDGHRGAARLHGGDHGRGFAQQVGLGQALADLQACGQHEGVGDAAADDQAVDLLARLCRMVSLVLTLLPATMATSGRFGLARALVMASISADSSGPGAGHRRELRNAVGAGLGPVRGAEGVVHEDVAQRGHLARQRLVVLLLALVDAAVLQQHHLAGLPRRTPSTQWRPADTRRPSSSPGGRPPGPANRLGLELAFGRAAQVAGDHHRRTGVQRHADAGHRGADAGVFGDAAGVVLRHVEVGTDEHTLALCRPWATRSAKRSTFMVVLSRVKVGR
jgi:hypothetical protein